MEESFHALSCTMSKNSVHNIFSALWELGLHPHQSFSRDYASATRSHPLGIVLPYVEMLVLVPLAE